MTQAVLGIPSSASPIVLRPYQKDALDALVAYKRKMTERHPYGGKRALVAMATGTGKTVLFAQIPKLARKKTLILAHRDELIDQTIEKVLAANPSLIVGREQAEDRAGDHAQVVVASVQTLAVSGARLRALDPDDFSVIVYDEAHHALSDGSIRILQHFGLMPHGDDISWFDPDFSKLDEKERKIRLREYMAGFAPGINAPLLIGFTATPTRADGRGLEHIFDDIVYSMGIEDAIDQGWLSPIRGHRVNTKSDISDVPTQGGELVVSKLSGSVNNKDRNTLAVDNYCKHAFGRQAIVFCVDVQHTADMAAAFKARGILADMVIGASLKDDRRNIVSDYRAGKIQVLVNCAVALEGFDAPETSCIIMARPTKSSLLYCLDERTEALTPSGWKRGSELQIGDLVAGFSPVNGSVQWEPVQDQINRPLYPDEYMLKLQSPTVDLRVTNTHRMVWKPRRTRNGRHSKAGWEIVKAEVVAAARDSWDLPVAGIQSAIGALLTDAEIRFIGWVETDGTVNRHTQAVQIGQAMHQPQRADLEATLTACGFKWRYNDETKPTNFGERRHAQRIYRVSRGKPRGTDKDKRGWGALAPWIPKADPAAWERLETLDARQLGVLLEAWHLGDGQKQLGQSWTRRSYHLTIGDLATAERLQSLCVRRGWRANLAWNDHVWTLHCRALATRTVGGAGAKDRQSFRRDVVHPDERVWCITVPSGAFISRRNGKVAVVGNTQAVGRGLRLAGPMKKDCLVIDMVDVSRKTGIQTLNTMFGIPPNLTLPDRMTISEAKKKWGDLEGKIPMGLVDDAVSFSEIEDRAEQFDPLRQATIEPELSAATKLAWVKTSFGYAVSVKDVGQIGAVIDMLDHVRLRVKPKDGDAQHLGNFDTTIDALTSAEEWLQGQNVQGFAMASREAKWRGAPASEKQLSTLDRLHVKYPPGISKGEASALLDKKMGELDAIPASIKQLNYLARRGIAFSQGISKREAQRLIVQDQGL